MSTEQLNMNQLHSNACNTLLQSELNSRKYILGILVVVCIGFGAAFFFLRSYYNEPVGDDLLYRYVLDKHPFGENILERKIHTLGDAIESQSTQYFYSNGRTIVHVLVQMFAGVWGHVAFCVVNTLMFIAAVMLVCKYCFNGMMTRNIWCWIVVMLSFFYLFPGGGNVWYSIAGAFNYMYPIMLVSGFLVIYNRVILDGKHLTGWKVSVISLFAFITGWSQECFAVPLTGATLIYVLTNYKHCGNKVRIVSLFLWIGTAVLIFARGNLIRAMTSAKPFGATLYWAAHYFIATYIVAILLGLSIYLVCKDKVLFKRFVQENKMLLYAWVISCVMGCLANTLIQSFYGIAFFSILLTFKILPLCFNIAKKPKWINGVGLAILLAFFAHQTMIVSAQKKIQHFHRDFLRSYIESSDGRLTEPKAPYRLPLVRPYAVTWFEHDASGWIMLTIQQYYGSPSKPLVLVTSQDSIPE